MRWMTLGKFEHDLTSQPKPIDDGLDKGKSSPFMALIQISEIILIYPDDILVYTWSDIDELIYLKGFEWKG